jgi:peptide/nickel transport system substrate-binding protein
VARIIAQQLEAVGIGIELRSFEFATFFADVKAGNYQLASMQTSEIIDPDMYFFYFHRSRIPTPETPDEGNRWRYRSARADALIEAGRFALDRARRREIYGELQRLLAEDLPILPLWHEDNVVVSHRDVSGYRILPNARLVPLARTTKASYGSRAQRKPPPANR